MRPLFVVFFALLPLLARAESPRVLTDIPPVHSLTAMVMEGVGSPALLLPPGTDPHHVQLRPSQAKEIAEADLIVWTGPDLLPQIDRIVARSAAKSVALQEGDGHGHGEDDHDEHGAHGWLDPETASGWLSDIADGLSAVDPGNAAAYRANAAAAEARIAALTAEVEALFATLEDRQIVVYHDAYDPFAAHFGLTVAGAILEGDAAPAGAAGLSALREALGSGHLHCVFTEPGGDPDLVRAVTEDTLVDVAELDPTGARLAPGPGLYLDLIAGMAATIHGCLSQLETRSYE